MGLIFMARGDEAGALRAFEEVLKINPHARGARARGDELRKKTEGSGRVRPLCTPRATVPNTPLSASTRRLIVSALCLALPNNFGRNVRIDDRIGSFVFIISDNFNEF